MKFQKGFTILELLLSITLVGVLAGIIMYISIKGAAQARDAKRIQELYQIVHALQLYYAEHGKYPENTDSGDVGCWMNWDGGSILNGPNDSFIKPLKEEGFLKEVPIEKRPTGDSNWEKCSYRYIKTKNACGCKGTWAVLYATCETNKCPVKERPDCCIKWGEGAGDWDKRDIAIFLKEK